MLVLILKGRVHNLSIFFIYMAFCFVHGKDLKYFFLNHPKLDPLLCAGIMRKVYTTADVHFAHQGTPRIDSVQNT